MIGCISLAVNLSTRNAMMAPSPSGEIDILAQFFDT